MKKYDTAVVVGKFHPFHHGHQLVVNKAIEVADLVVVLVVDGVVAGRTVPATRRAAWIQEAYAHEAVSVRVMPDIEVDDDSEAWADYTKAFLGFTPDAVVTSESYGHTWALALECAHVVVDPLRNLIPFSATQFFDDPIAGLDYLPREVRGDYIPRVCVVGAESTGTTTLSKALASHYRTKWVPEYGRERDERRINRREPPNDWAENEFYMTARVQQANENTLAKQARDVLICDTDALATYLWLHRYHKNPSKHWADKVLDVASEQRYDLYIVTSPKGIEPEEDGLRFEMEKRDHMHEQFIRLLGMWKRPYIIVEGERHERLDVAVKAIDQIINR